MLTPRGLGLAPGCAVIGDVEIGAGSSIWFGCVIRGDVQPIRIGERTNVQDGTIVHVTQDDLPTRIGSDVLIGHGCLIHACTLEDILMRRTMLGLRPGMGLELAERVSQIAAPHLGWSESETAAQVAAYRAHVQPFIAHLA